MKIYSYECAWVEEDNDGVKTYKFKEFDYLRDAMKFYKDHKDDSNKTDWWVTKRYNDDWSVAKDYIY